MQFWTRRDIRKHLQNLYLQEGDHVFIHAALRSIGPILSGPDAFIRSVLDVVGPQGTLLVYTDWEDFDLIEDQPVPIEMRSEVLPFDSASSRARRANGSIAELVRTFPGAKRSANPGASCAAIGFQAEWLVSEHALQYGYGEQSPFAKLVAAGGKVLMAGAPSDTMTLLHHAEHLAQIPGKRIRRYEAPILIDGAVAWTNIEEFDTSDPVIEGLRDDYFADIVREFMLESEHYRGFVGDAESIVVPAKDMVAFAVAWLERRFA